MPRKAWGRVFAGALPAMCAAALAGIPAAAQAPPSAACPDRGALLRGPILTDGGTPAGLPAAKPGATDKPLPINLATALRLAGARPVLIEAAVASEQAAAALWEKSRVLWLPSFNVGAGYYRHDGATQGQSGNLYVNSKDQLFAGAGLSAKVETADAIFAPLAARQVLRAREIDVQTARNDALLTAAEAYFAVQLARGRLAAATDVVEKAQALGRAIDAERLAVSKPTDMHRARALLADFEDAVESARE